MGLFDRLFRRPSSEGRGANPRVNARSEEMRRYREELAGLRPTSPDQYGVKVLRSHGTTIKIEFREFDDALFLDLRSLPTAQYGIKGYSFYAAAGRWVEADSYRLVREPQNPEDRWAIAVFNVERKVGYVSHSNAVKYAPLLDELPAEVFVVGGVVRERGKMLLLLPKLPDLRRLVKQQTASGAS